MREDLLACAGRVDQLVLCSFLETHLPRGSRDQTALSSVIIGPSRVACDPPALHSYPRSGKALPVVMTMLNSITRNKPKHEFIMHWFYQRPSIILYFLWSFV